MRWISLSLLVFWASGAAADRVREPPRDGISGSNIRVHAGNRVDVPLPGPAQAVCDDVSVARVEDAGQVLRVVGVAPGNTRCGFHSIAPGQFRRVYDVQVLPP